MMSWFKMTFLIRKASPWVRAKLCTWGYALQSGMVVGVGENWISEVMDLGLMPLQPLAPSQLALSVQEPVG